MAPSKNSLPSELEREIRAGRKFSLGEAIGREGGSFLKGSQEMVPRPLRAWAAVKGFIEQHLMDRDGALQPCLKRWVKADVRVSQYLGQPLVALQKIVTEIVEEPQVLYEFARQVAVEWGQMNGERPQFQKPGTKAPPEAVYAHERVQEILLGLLERLEKELGDSV